MIKHFKTTEEWLLAANEALRRYHVLTPAELAAKEGISRQAINDRIRKGKLDCLVMHHRLCVVILDRVKQ